MPTESVPQNPVAYRQVARHAIEHYLASVRILTEALNVDLGAAVVFLTVARLNLGRILADPQAAMRFAGIATPPPDHERQPVSVYAVAQDLGLPYETARRYVNSLVKLGHCERRPGSGLIVTQQFLTGPIAQTLGATTMDLVIGHVRDLAACGLTVPATSNAQGDIRAHVARLNARHVLDLLKLLGSQLGLDMISGLVLLGVIAANNETIRKSPDLAMRYGSMDQVAPDELREPVSTYALAKRLRLPYETTRRYVLALVDLGLCVRLPRGGVLVPSRAQSRPGFASSSLGSVEATRKFLVDLAAAGISGESQPG
jgi:DNA-binding transcriptional regulator YhcF (GntR family)